jgi:hypothetical protein
MNTRQLLQCFQQDETLRKYSTGVHASDVLPKIECFPSCLIANTDPTNLPGKHWVAIFIGTDEAEFFDSYGLPPASNLSSYIRKYRKPVTYNGTRVQGPLSSTCGHYCLYYLCHRVRGKSMKNIVNDFCTDYSLNDLYIAEYVRQHFNIDVKAFDLKFLVDQICKSE